MYSYDDMTMLRLQLGRWAPDEHVTSRDRKHNLKVQKYQRNQMSPRGQGRRFTRFRRWLRVRPAGL